MTSFLVTLLITLGILILEDISLSQFVAPRAKLRDWAEGFGLVSLTSCQDITLPHESPVAEYVAEKFVNQCRGSFIDVGANEGFGSNSNSNELENGLGWRGVCVEPHPHSFKRMEPQRPNCRLINAGAAPVSGGVLKFVAVEGYAEMLSTFQEGMPADHMDRIDSEVAKFGGRKEIIDVNLMNITDIVLGSPRHSRFAVVDFLSVDVERRELYVLEGVDFDHIFFRMIMLESNTLGDRKSHEEVLSHYGYTQYQTWVRGSPNDVYLPTDACTKSFVSRVAKELVLSSDSIDIGFRVG